MIKFICVAIIFVSYSFEGSAQSSETSTNSKLTISVQSNFYNLWLNSSERKNSDGNNIGYAKNRSSLESGLYLNFKSKRGYIYELGVGKGLYVNAIGLSIKPNEFRSSAPNDYPNLTDELQFTSSYFNPSLSFGKAFRIGSYSLKLKLGLDALFMNDNKIDRFLVRKFKLVESGQLFGGTIAEQSLSIGVYENRGAIVRFFGDIELEKQLSPKFSLGLGLKFASFYDTRDGYDASSFTYYNESFEIIGVDKFVHSYKSVGIKFSINYTIKEIASSK